MIQLSPPKTGTLLAGRYLLAEELGTGGMGSVYRATDRRTGGAVAVKLLHPTLARSATYRERLRREALIAAALTSPRVVRIVDLDEHEGILFIVQEYVAGETLHQRLQREGALPLLEALAIGREVARALEAAQAAGIVHRDLKPENIKLVEGQVKVLDFGIARADGITSLTATDSWIGTAEFCAPERALGVDDIRADIYSLGVVLFQLITGRLPFTGATPVAIMRQHEFVPPPIPEDLPHLVQAILARCLAKQPAARYQTPADLIADLGEAIAFVHAAPLAPDGPPRTAGQGAGRPGQSGVDETAELPAVLAAGVLTPAPAERNVAPEPFLAPPGRGNLPLQITSFVGRAKEQVSVRHLLATSRVLTLAGPAGIGKTRLALQVASDAAGDYADGVWLVPLAPLGDPHLIAQSVADTLDVHEVQGRPPLTTLAESLRRKRLLLILDNCEHVVDACAMLAQTLVQSCPGVTVLATSREPLGIGGEVLWRVPPLDLKGEAVQLFAERAAAAHPGFTLTPDAEALVAEICWRLDGLPLAIELAAARVKVLSLAEIIARLDDRLRLLSSRSRTALPHQQTLRAAIDWSYDLLSEAEQTLFRRLGVFADGCTLDAATAVAGAIAAMATGGDAPQGDDPHAARGNVDSGLDVLEGMAALVDKSLLVHETAVGGESRFVMLQTIREYALERLRESGEAAAIQDRHLDLFLTLAQRADHELRGRDQLVWLARLEQEHDNLRSALEWSAAAPGRAARGLRLATALGWFWYLRGQRSEGTARLVDLLGRGASEGVPAATRALASGVAAYLTLWSLDAAAALPLAEDACRFAVETGDPLVQAWALLYRAVAEPRHESRAVAIARWEESLALFRRAGENWGVALSLSWLGSIAFSEGNVAVAIQHLEEGQSLFRLLGDRWGIALVLDRLANIAEYEGDDQRAEVYFEEQQVLARELGHRGAIAGGLSRLAGLSLRRGAVDQAEARFEESLALFRAIGEERSTAAPLRQLARLVARYRHDYPRAEALLAESLRVWQEHEGIVGPIRGLLAAVDLALLQGAWERSAHLLAAAHAAIERGAGEIDAGARRQLDADVQELRAALQRAGAAPEMIQGAGEPLSLREAIDYTLSGASTPSL